MRFLFVMCFVFLFASGCAVQQQQKIQYSDETLSNSAKIGIAMSGIPAVDASYPGADCLLCLAAAATANSKLTSYVEKQLSAEDLNKIPVLVQSKLKELGYEAVIIDSPLKANDLPKLKSDAVNTAKRDFSHFKEQYDLDYLVGIEFSYVGVKRQYASYVPTSDPQALILGVEYVIRIKDNTYTWYKPLNTYRSAEGEWKEPPSYPGLTNAFYQVIEAVLDEVINISSGEVHEGEVVNTDLEKIESEEKSKGHPLARSSQAAIVNPLQKSK